MYLPCCQVGGVTLHPLVGAFTLSVDIAYSSVIEVIPVPVLPLPPVMQAGVEYIGSPAENVVFVLLQIYLPSSHVGIFVSHPVVGAVTDDVDLAYSTSISVIETPLLPLVPSCTLIKVTVSDNPPALIVTVILLLELSVSPP